MIKQPFSNALDLRTVEWLNIIYMINNSNNSNNNSNNNNYMVEFTY